MLSSLVAFTGHHGRSNE